MAIKQRGIILSERTTNVLIRLCINVGLFRGSCRSVPLLFAVSESVVFS